MVTLKRLNRRIRSINNAKQVTRTMEMIAASRLNKALIRLSLYRPYAQKLEEIFSRCGHLTKSSTHPFLEKRKNNRALVIVVTSSRGLCGAYNTNLLKTADAFLAGFKPNKVKMITVGKKSYRHYQKLNFEIIKPVFDFDINWPKQKIDELYKTVKEIFISKQIDQVYIIYSKFISKLKYRPAAEKLLNLESSPGENMIEYIVEPDRESLLKSFLPTYVISKITHCLFESLVCEYSARAIAMKIATDNADDLLEELSLLRNKTRQADITKEILEIITTAEALS